MRGNRIYTADYRRIVRKRRRTRSGIVFGLAPIRVFTRVIVVGQDAIALDRGVNRPITS